jgi:hypothetical protein
MQIDTVNVFLANCDGDWCSRTWMRRLNQILSFDMQIKMTFTFIWWRRKSWIPFPSTGGWRQSRTLSMHLMTETESVTLPFCLKIETGTLFLYLKTETKSATPSWRRRRMTFSCTWRRRPVFFYLKTVRWTFILPDDGDKLKILFSLYTETESRVWRYPVCFTGSRISNDRFKLMEILFR